MIVKKVCWCACTKFSGAKIHRRLVQLKRVRGPFCSLILLDIYYGFVLDPKIYDE